MSKLMCHISLFPGGRRTDGLKAADIVPILRERVAYLSGMFSVTHFLPAQAKDKNIPQLAISFYNILKYVNQESLF